MDAVLLRDSSAADVRCGWNRCALSFYVVCSYLPCERTGPPHGMNRVLLIFTAFVALLQQGYGCLNHYVPNARALKAGEDAYTRITNPTAAGWWEAVRDDMAAKLEKSRDIKTLNDLAVAMIHTGGVAEAVPLLEEIERTQPGLYQTATNLGTAYELLGHPKQALTWIEQGIAINPDSHGGSEWISDKVS